MPVYSPERQPHPPPERLLGQDVGDAAPHRRDDVDVLDVPALLQHPDRDDDPNGRIGVLDFRPSSARASSGALECTTRTASL